MSSLRKGRQKLIMLAALWWGNIKVWVTGRVTFYYVFFFTIWSLNKSRYLSKQKIIKFTVNAIII